MSRLYRETYEDIKNEKEYEENEANRVYNKYHYLFDDDYKIHTKYSEMYDLGKEEKGDLDEIISTEMSDEETDYIYQRYKVMLYENKVSMEDIDEKAEGLHMSMRLNKGMIDGR